MPKTELLSITAVLWLCVRMRNNLSFVLNFGSNVAFVSLLQQVTMTDRGAAERACKDPNPIIDGRKANVNLAYLGAKPRSMQTGEEHAGEHSSLFFFPGRS